MKRLGFEDYNEYLEYLDFKTLKEGRKKPLVKLEALLLLWRSQQDSNLRPLS